MKTTNLSQKEIDNLNRIIASVMSDSLGRYAPSRLLHLWDSPGKNTGVGYHSLLQGIFPTKGLNQGLKPTSLSSAALAGGFFFYH